MNALLLAAAVVCQWDMAPPKTGDAAALSTWDMRPWKVGPKAEPAAVVVTAGYPARGGTRYWVKINGRNYSASPEHLLQGEHAGMFDEGWVRSLSQEDLNWLHSHAHTGYVNWDYAKRPGRWEKPATAAAASPKMKLIRQTVCINGRCHYQDVWVKDE